MNANQGAAPAKAGSANDVPRLLQVRRDFYPVPVGIPGAPSWLPAVEEYRAAA